MAWDRMTGQVPEGFFGPEERGLRTTLEGEIAFCFPLSAFCLLFFFLRGGLVGGDDLVGNLLRDDFVV
jgi:hypothetical protein